MLSKKFAKDRFSNIDLNKVKYKDNFKIPPGNPENYTQTIPDSTSEGHHTTQISIVDQEGNAVSLTQTLGNFFGSGLSVEGVLFNSSMLNFSSFDSPNGVDSGKRPLSTICPTIIMKDNKIFSVLGTPGGTNIFNTMAEVIIRLIDFDLSPVEAVDAPLFSPRITRKYVTCESRFSSLVLDSLSQFGHEVRIMDDYNEYLGGIQLIYFDKDSKEYIGVSDPRRAGAATGID